MGFILRVVGFGCLGSATAQAFQNDLPGLGVTLIIGIVCAIVGTAMQANRLG